MTKIICRKCNQTKDCSEYTKDACWCKTCRSEYNTKYHSNNKVRCRDYKKRWRAANPEKVKASRRAYGIKHKEEGKDRYQKWVRDNPEKVKSWGKTYRAINKEKIKRKKADHYAANKERLKTQIQDWYTRHKEDRKVYIKNYWKANRGKARAYNAKRRALESNADGKSYTKEFHILQRWEMFGKKCWMCGAPATCTDHVIPLSKGGAHWPANLRPACMSCNSKKQAKKLALNECEKNFHLFSKKHLTKTKRMLIS
jgi:hypothetical protein